MENFKKGMVDDLSQIDNPENSWLFALNMVNSSEESNYTELQNEAGNEKCWTLMQNNIAFIQMEIIGHVNLNEQEVLVIACNEDELTNTTKVNIYLVRDCMEKLILSQFSINTFQYTKKNLVKGVFKYFNNERIVYLYDGVNPDVFLRIDRLSEQLDSNGILIQKKIRHKPEYFTPNISLLKINNNQGSLLTGKYQIALRYVDSLGNKTDFAKISGLIPITKETGSYQQQDGSFDTEETNKSISFNFDYIDRAYEYIEVAAIAYNDGLGIPKAYIVDKIYTNGNNATTQTYDVNNIATHYTSFEYLLTRIDLNNSVQIPISEIITPSAKYESSYVMLQDSNRLLKANLKERNIDWGLVQKYIVNSIRSHYYVKAIPHDDVKSGKYDYQNKSLMRDEIYMLGLVITLKDGSKSPVLPLIPRMKDTTTQGVNIGSLVLDTYNFDHHNRLDPVTQATWDSCVYNPLVVTDEDFDIVNNSTNAERWQVYNTAIRQNTFTNPDGSTDSQGQFAYYESTALYPDIKLEDNSNVYPTGNVRCFKMPDCTLEPHFEYVGDKEFIRTLGVYIENIQLDNPLFPEELKSYKDYYDTIELVYADRNGNKTVLDKGILTSNIKLDYFADSDNDMPQESLYHQSLQHTTQPDSRVFSYTDHVRTITTSVPYPPFSQDYEFIPVPLGATNFIYGKFNNGGKGNTLSIPGQQMCNKLVSFHSPLSKFEKESMTGSHFKYELELYTYKEKLTEPMNHGNFQLFKERRKYEKLETKNILYTITSSELNKSWIPFGKGTILPPFPSLNLTNRVISNNIFIDTNEDYSSRCGNNYPYRFLNSSQQEHSLYEIESQLSEYSTDVWVNPVGSNREFLKHSPFTMANNHLDVESTYNDFGQYTKSYNYVAIKNNLTNAYNNFNYLKFYSFENNIKVSDPNVDVFDMLCFGGDIYINKFSFRRTYGGYIPNKDVAALTDFLEKNTTKESNPAQSYNSNVGAFGTTTNINSFFDAQLITFYCESDISSEFRNEGESVYRQEMILEDDQDVSGTNIRTSSLETKIEKYYPKSYSANKEEFLMLELNANSITRTKDDGTTERFTVFPNYYSLNKDYSVNNTIQPNFIYNYPLNYRYSNEYPNRIIWSEKSFIEDASDRYRVFRVNDYKDINANTGKITDLFTVGNKIMLNTERNFYMIPNNNQQLKTDTSTLYLGTGQYLALDEIKIGDVNYSYAGNQGRFNRITTEFGVVFVNQEQGKIYNFSDRLNDITPTMSRFMYKNLPSVLFKQLKDKFYTLVNEEFNFTMSDNILRGVGLMSVFDQNLNRYILYKRDYKLKDAYYNVLKLQNYKNKFGQYVNTKIPNTIIDDINSGDFVYDSERMKFGFSTGIKVNGIYGLTSEIKFNENSYQYFEDASFTISYDLASKQFISFHSYKPAYMYSNGYNFYTTNPFPDFTDINSQIPRVYKHLRQGRYGVFFLDTDISSPDIASYKHDAIVEFVNYRSANSSTLESVQYLLRTELYDSNTKTFKEKFSNPYKGITYNSIETTGMYGLYPYSSSGQAYSLGSDDTYYNTQWATNNKFFSYKDNWHRVTGLRSLTKDKTQPIFTKDFDVVKTELTPYFFNGQGYLDKTINVLHIDYNKSQFQQNLLKDVFGVTRLFFNTYKIALSNDDIRFRIQLQNTNQLISKR